MRAGARLRACAVALLALAPLLPAGSRSIEEWQVSTARRVQGKWRMAELQLFSDAACSKRLLAQNASSFSGHPVTEKVHVLRPVQNGGQDCVEHCDGKSGYCTWCGEGNACCRKGFKADPEECHKAEAFTTATQHECVSVPGEELQTHSGGDKALDGKDDTSYQVDCGKEGCSAGALMLGGALVQENAQVKCVAVLQRRDDAIAGAAVQVSLLRRPAFPAGSAGCPGACRSGRYTEGSATGVCQEYLSQRGSCGSTADHSSRGWDCRGCTHLEPATPRLLLKVATRETFSDQQVVVTKLKASNRRSEQVPLQHTGEDCWGPCISGYCSWCGEGHACCKSGGDTDMPECADATGFVASHHECVALIRSSAGFMDGLAEGGFPPWVITSALVVPWVTIGLGLLCYTCRGKAGCCCGICRKEKNKEPSFKPMSGEVFKPRVSRNNGDNDEFRKKVLREQAKKLDWLT